MLQYSKVVIKDKRGDVTNNLVSRFAESICIIRQPEENIRLSRVIEY